MTFYLNLRDIRRIHRRVLRHSGGASGMLSVAGLESSVAQPHAAFGGKELYPGLVEKAAALGFSLIQNHPFADGNKRVGRVAVETFLVLNGFEIEAAVDEQEQVILAVASGSMSREALTTWLRTHTIPVKTP